MGMCGDDRIDVLGIDAGRLEAGHQLAGGRTEHGGRAHAGVDQHELVAGVQDQHVLLEDHVGRRQEIVGQHLADLVLGFLREGFDCGGDIQASRKVVGGEGTGVIRQLI